MTAARAQKERFDPKFIHAIGDEIRFADRLEHPETVVNISGQSPEIVGFSRDWTFGPSAEG